MTVFAYPETDALYETISLAGRQPFRHGGLPVDDNHELALLQHIKAGNSDARQKLITGNLRHVLHSNKRYARSGAGIFDLLKAGNQGLVHALDNFEAEGDENFSAYAASCIRRHIERALNLDECPKERNTPSPAQYLGSSGQHQAAMHMTPDTCPN